MGEAGADETQAGEQLAALAVARSAAGVEADAVLDGVVDDEARGAQAVAHLADQWWGGDALGHLSHVGGGQDGGDGGSQIARQPGFVLDQAAGEGVEDVATPGPCPAAQCGQSYGLLHGGQHLGGSQWLAEPSQGGGDVDDHGGGEGSGGPGRLRGRPGSAPLGSTGACAAARERTGPGAGPPGSLPQAR